MKKTLSVIALLLSLATVLSFGSITGYAESSEVSAESSEISVVESVDASEDSSVDSSADASDDVSEGSSADATKDATADETTEESSKESSEADTTKDNGNKKSEFPWALVIFLSLIVILAVVAFICIKLNNKVGIWLVNFFKDYKSEIKKVTWPSREVTIKSTIVVLVCLLVCATVISLFDFGLGKLVEWLLGLVK